MTSTTVTAALLNDLVSCPHRVTMDLTGDPEKRDKPHAFVELLWERGSRYEKAFVAGLTELVVDLSGYGDAEKERLTDDCRATRVLRDALEALPVEDGGVQ